MLDTLSEDNDEASPFLFKKKMLQNEDLIMNSDDDSYNKQIQKLQELKDKEEVYKHEDMKIRKDFRKRMHT